MSQLFDLRSWKSHLEYRSGAAIHILLYNSLRRYFSLGRYEKSLIIKQEHDGWSNRALAVERQRDI